MYNMKKNSVLEFLGHIPYWAGWLAGKIVSAVRFCVFAIQAGYLDAIRDEPW